MRPDRAQLRAEDRRLRNLLERNIVTYEPQKPLQSSSPAKEPASKSHEFVEKQIRKSGLVKRIGKFWQDSSAQYPVSFRRLYNLSEAEQLLFWKDLAKGDGLVSLEAP